MTPLEVIEKQGVIIQLQEKLILDLFRDLAQHTAVEEAEKQFSKIKEMERDLHRCNTIKSYT